MIPTVTSTYPLMETVNTFEKGLKDMRPVIRKRLLAIGVAVLMIGPLLQSAVVFADHDHRKESREYEDENEYDDEDEYDDEYGDEYERYDNADDAGNFTGEQISLEQQADLLVPAETVLTDMNIPYVEYDGGLLLEMFANERHVIFHADKRNVYIDGQPRYISTPPAFRDNQYYIPIDVLAFVFNTAPVWDPIKQTWFLMEGQ
jgi:hypothetical protein